MAVPAGLSSTAALKQKFLAYGDNHTRDFSELDTTILADILSHLSLETIASCQLACKKFDLLTTDPRFIKLHLNRVTDQILIQPIPSENDVVNHHLYLINPRTSVCTPFLAPLLNMEIMCTYDGLLCVKGRDRHIDTLWLYNPVTRTNVMLPTSEPSRVLSSHVVSLGFDSITGRHKLVRHYRFERGHKIRRLEILTLGQSSWRIINCELPEGHSYRALFCQGVFYLQFYHRQTEHPRLWELSVLVIDSSSEESRIISFPHRFVSQPFVEMLDIGGKVILIEHDRKWMWRWVMKKKSDGNYKFDLEEIYDTGRKWTKKIYYETLCEVGVGGYVAKFTTWHDVPDGILRFFPGRAEERYERINIPNMSYSFNAYNFKPTFLDPAVAASAPVPSD